MKGIQSFNAKSLSDKVSSVTVQSNQNDISLSFTGPISHQEYDFINSNPLRIPVPDLVGESEYALSVDVAVTTSAGDNLPNIPIKVYLQQASFPYEIVSNIFVI